MAGVNGWEFILLALIAVFVLGPDRLPEYAAKLAHGIRRLRVMAEGAKDQLRDQLGPEYEDINWRQYDPRQYDPRRIVREALLDPLDDAVAPVRDEIGSVRDAARFRDGAETGGAAAAGAGTGEVPGDDEDPPEYEDDLMDDDELVMDREEWGRPRAWDPSRPTPFDTDAT
ncbi:twin-arginine translocase TatA/TatE family subunit [Phycicoccus sp. CSK15P-2]|uniref:twin-arginine translocase TatA/TatE family subunit n=1 Tax=Phycicoccus sp. CSK15P-2 TaxID=2807627 RepID=UPI00194F6256|nr:twin-arginine translocase TatA/TatE family subunit [Phycicoccus sp. CSK15P-2]MBM6405138.1 twin-arginine translocase TatA/TatE family subunit [Phycicoccus sp. CSK15P-2]